MQEDCISNELRMPIIIDVHCSLTTKHTHLVHRTVKKLKTMYGCLQQFAAIDDHIVQVVVTIVEVKRCVLNDSPFVHLIDIYPSIGKNDSLYVPYIYSLSHSFNSGCIVRWVYGNQFLGELIEQLNMIFVLV